MNLTDGDIMLKQTLGLALAAGLAVLAGCAGDKGQYQQVTVQQGGGRTGQAWIRTDQESKPYTLQGEQKADQKEQRYIAERQDIGGRPTVRRVPVKD